MDMEHGNFKCSTFSSWAWVVRPCSAPYNEPSYPLQPPNLPSKAGKPHWSPFLAQQAADSEQQPRPAHGAGCERQRWPCSPQVQARRWRPVSPRAALVSWAGWGCSRRQAAPSPQAREKAAANNLTSQSRKRPPAWNSSACLWERGCLFPAPPMPLQHHPS